MDDLRRLDLNLLLTRHTLLTEKHVTRAAVHLHKANPQSVMPWRNCGHTSTTRCWCAVMLAQLAAEVSSTHVVTLGKPG